MLDIDLGKSLEHFCQNLQYCQCQNRDVKTKNNLNTEPKQSKDRGFLISIEIVNYFQPKTVKIYKNAAPIVTKNSTKPPDAGRTEKRRNLQRALG